MHPHYSISIYVILFEIILSYAIFSLTEDIVLRYSKDGRFQVICKNKGRIQVSHFLSNTNYMLFNDKISPLPINSTPDKTALYICNQLRNINDDIKITKSTADNEKILAEQRFKIVIDPGHGGKFIGTTGSTLLEKDLNLDISLRLYELLKSKYEVILTRNADKELKDSLIDDLNERVNIAHKIWADLFVSIHHNFAYNLSVRGFEIYLPTYTNWSEKANKLNAISSLLANKGYKNANHYYNYLKTSTATLAGIIAKKIHTLLPFNGIKNKDIRVLRENLVPAILLEIEYISNSDAENFLLSIYNRQKVATTLAESIDEYFSINTKSKLRISE